MGNRRKQEVWKYFRKVGQNPHGKLKMSCNFCGCTYLENATRMSSHLHKCPEFLKTPEGLRIANSQLLPISGSNSMTALDFLGPSFSGAARPESRKYKLTERTRMLCRAIFSSGAPLSLVEDPYWGKFLFTLSPGYTLPSRDELVTECLSHEYRCLRQKVDRLINDESSFGLICQGTSYQLCNVFVALKTPVFQKCAVRPDSDTLNEFLKNAIDRLDESKIIGIVYRRLCNLKQTTQLDDKFSHMSLYECFLDLLVRFREDIFNLPYTISIINQVQIVLSYLNDQLTAGVQTPDYIKNIAHLDVNSYTTISELYKSAQLVTNFTSSTIGKDSDADKLQLIFSIEFWLSLERLSNILMSISDIISCSRRRLPQMADVIPILSQVELAVKDNVKVCQSFSESDQHQFLSCFRNSKASFLQPIHFAAHLLDPHYKGSLLSLEQQVSASEYIDRLAIFTKDLNDEDVMVDLANYKACDGIWGKEYIWKAVHKIHPVSWWNGFCSNTKLAYLANRIFRLPATSEVGVSLQIPAETKISGLKNEQLLFVHANLRLLQKEEPETETPLEETLTEEPLNFAVKCEPDTQKEMMEVANLFNQNC